jgi:ABC-type uncharacterized transport system substrate-binding protein
VFFAVGVLCFASPSAEAATPKRVIVLQSNGENFKPWSDYVRTFRHELERRSSTSVIVQYFPVPMMSNEAAEEQLVGYLNALFQVPPADLVVTFGAPAAAFLQKFRGRLFPATPVLFAAIDQRRVEQSKLTEKDSVVPIWNDIPALFENIFQVLPQTKTIAVVIGHSPIEQLWAREIAVQLAPLRERATLLFWNDRSFEEILAQAETLPKNSAIFWIQPQIDATGVVHDGERALKRLHAVSSAPIFSHDDAYFNAGIVGGPMTSVMQGSSAAASVALRLLDGEKPKDHRIAALKYGPPKYDWRELDRWNISEKSLPPESEVFYRALSAWDLYRWQILSACMALLCQAALISGLLYNLRKRIAAETVARQRMAELDSRKPLLDGRGTDCIYCS